MAVRIRNAVPRTTLTPHSVTVAHNSNAPKCGLYAWALRACLSGFVLLLYLNWRFASTAFGSTAFPVAITLPCCSHYTANVDRHSKSVLLVDRRKMGRTATVCSPAVHRPCCLLLHSPCPGEGMPAMIWLTVPTGCRMLWLLKSAAPLPPLILRQAWLTCCILVAAVQEVHAKTPSSAQQKGWQVYS